MANFYTKIILLDVLLQDQANVDYRFFNAFSFESYQGLSKKNYFSSPSLQQDLCQGVKNCFSNFILKKKQPKTIVMEKIQLC